MNSPFMMAAATGSMLSIFSVAERAWHGDLKGLARAAKCSGTLSVILWAAALLEQVNSTRDHRSILVSSVMLLSSAGIALTGLLIEKKLEDRTLLAVRNIIEV